MKPRSLVLSLTIVLTVLWLGHVPQVTAQSPGIKGPSIGSVVKPVSFQGNLRNLPRSNPARKQVPPVRSILPVAGKALSSSPDPLRQRVLPTLRIPGPIGNFAGLNFSSNGLAGHPDTNGDVGLNHYIQAVNTSIGIFSKTGTLITTSTFDALFLGRDTSPCSQGDNVGDPIVLYDDMADRWIISDVAWTSATGPFYECLAVSKTADPVTGGWYFYNFVPDPNSPFLYLHSDPKLGVWPDAYYMSANMFQGTRGPFQGVRVWALDRAKMLNGQAFSPVSFLIPCNALSCHASLLPGNLKGNEPPPGTPGFFLSTEVSDTGGSGLNLWKFSVNWTTPADSTLIGPTRIPVANYVYPVNIPQPSPGVALDARGDRLMMPLQYRNIGGTESLWANHTVQSGTVSGIRWYEIRDPNHAPTLFQQGTYQPDNLYRWMGSLAVDKYGNMALGYSVSSTGVFPSIRYAGRLKGDPAGQLGQGETTLIAGTGSQTDTDQWGEYSSMTVDPTDDCTFWYTNEYYQTHGTQWQTRIGSFRFPTCAPPAPPSNPSPADNSILEPRANVALSWTASNVDQCRVRLWGGASTDVTSPLLTTCSSYSFGARPPGAFRWQVAVTNTSGSTMGPEWQLKIRPSPPTNPTAAPAPSNQINLKWTLSADDPPGVDFYYAYQRDGTRVGLAGPGESSLAVKSLDCPVTYSFYVEAHFQGVASNRSALASATTNSCPNAAPANLRISGTTLTSITLAWEDKSNNEKEFRVYRNQHNSTGFVLRARVGAGVTKYTDMGLSPYSSYYYKVTAFNELGETYSVGPVWGTTGFVRYLPFITK